MGKFTPNNFPVDLPANEQEWLLWYRKPKNTNQLIQEMTDEEAIKFILKSFEFGSIVAIWVNELKD